MTREQALLRLGETLADALRTSLAARGAEPAGVDVAAVAEGVDPLADSAAPAVLATARSVDEAVGGSLLVLGVDAARQLASLISGEGSRPGDVGLSERELDALAPCVEELMQATAVAMGALLDEEVATSSPSLRVATHLEGALPDLERAGQACRVAFTLFGTDCAFVQVLPHAAIVRMTGARDELPTPGGPAVPLRETLRRIDVRVWAELGRARMPSGRASALPEGAVVELDRLVEEEIDLYADGMRFARGRLVVDDEGALSVRIESLADPEPVAAG